MICPRGELTLSAYVKSLLHLTDVHCARAYSAQETDHSLAVVMAGLELACAGLPLQTESQAYEALAHQICAIESFDNIDHERSATRGARHAMEQVDDAALTGTGRIARSGCSLADEENPGYCHAGYEQQRTSRGCSTESSVSAARCTSSGSVMKCVSCYDSPSVAKTPCGHWYCRECLTSILQNAVSRPGAYPPRCCKQEITLPGIRQHLDLSFTDKYARRAVELTSPDPVYCHHPRCAAFIPPETCRGADNAEYPACTRTTCTHCKAEAHHGDCPEDQALNTVLDLARDRRWQGCECGQVVELNDGCNHVTVRFPDNRTSCDPD